MKKIILTIAIITGFAFSANAQKKQKQHQKSEFTVEQQSTIAVKKLTLVLDLTDAQQNKMYPLLLDACKDKQAMKMKREANKGEKPELSNEERYNKIIEKLDKKIAFQGNVKKILDKEQYEKWHKMKAHKNKKKSSKKGKKGNKKHPSNS